MRITIARMLALAWAAVLGACTGQGPRAAVPISDAERQVAIESFDRMWTIVRDQHFDPNLNGVDWEAVRSEVRPRVEAARTRDETVLHMNEALHRLGQSHFGVIDASAYAGMEGPGGDSEGGVGLDVRALNGEAMVVEVEPGSPAESAGIRPGWLIEEIDGKETRDFIETVASIFEGQAKEAGMVSHALRGRLTGRIGQQIRLALRDGSGRRRVESLRMVALAGEPIVFGNLPPMRLTYESRRLAGGAGYVRFSAFFEPVTLMPWFRERIAEYAAAPGLVIDLRGNPGGIGFLAVGMGNMLVSERDLRLGTMTMREGQINFVLNPQVGRYTGPVAILVDEVSMSTSEIMSGGLQAIGRARVFGVPTPGLALPSQITKLPSGDGFQFATANYVSADGRTLEGHGVIPDEVVRPDRASILLGRDPVLEAAEAWISGQGNRGGT